MDLPLPANHVFELEKLTMAVAAAGGGVDIPTDHIFAEGVYCRKAFIPKGTVIVGRTHRRQTLNICALGDISILTTQGAARFKSGDVVVSEAGIKKIGFAHEDTIWINVFPTSERDIEKIEEMFSMVDYGGADPEVLEFVKLLESR